MARTALKPQSTIPLDLEKPFYPKLSKGLNIFEGGPEHVIFAEVGDQDILFWASPYFLHGATRDGFMADRAATVCTMFLAVPKKLRGHMNDTDYICQGFSPADYGKDTELKVTSTANQVVWKYRGSEFACRPPYWTAKGNDGDLSYDLKITGTAPTSYYIGDFKKFPKEVPVADFDQFTTCTGTIKAGQKTYAIAKGFGGHEHCISTMAMGQVFNQGSTAQQMLWFVGGGDPLQFFCFSWGNHRYGRIMVDGEYLPFGDNDVTVHTLEHWKDPRSLVTMPCRWHVNMRSPKAIVDVEAAASGRINRIWAMRFGYLLDTWFLGTLNGSVLYPNGRVVPVKDVLYEVEWVRTLWP